MKHVLHRLMIPSAIVVGGLILAIIIHLSYGKSEIDQIHSVDDLTRMGVRVGHQVYAENFIGAPDWISEEEVFQSYLDVYDQMDYHLIVRGTGNLDVSYLTTFQEFEVVEVLKGDLPKGERYFCDFTGGRVERDSTSGLSLATYGVNYMQKDREYLLFCDFCDMTNFSKNTYVMIPNGISYFALDNDYVAVLNDTDILYNEDTSRYEFYTESEGTIPLVKEFKEKLLSVYLDSRQ